MSGIAIPLGEGDDRCEFSRLARPRQRQNHVAVLHHAEIAVARLGRMDEGGGLPGRGQRRGDLARHVAGLAHAGHNQSAAGGSDGLHGKRKGRAEPGLASFAEGGFEGLEADPFGLERPERGADRARLFLNHGPLVPVSEAG